jgi:hypothetical protein
MFGLSPLEAVIPVLAIVLGLVIKIGLPIAAFVVLWQELRKQRQSLQEIKALLEQK